MRETTGTELHTCCIMEGLGDTQYLSGMPVKLLSVVNESFSKILFITLFYFI